MIDLKPEYLSEIKRILAEYAPGCEVWAFGSRVNGRSRKNSDVDIVLISKTRLKWQFIERMKDVFAESDLPFIIDVLDWDAISDEFRKLIAQNYQVIQKPH